MEAERADGIVLRTQPVTESSLVVTWYTRQWGKLRTLAKGARRAKSPLRGKMDLFYEDEILFLWSKRSDLHLLHECFLVEAHAGLRQSLGQLAGATYVCELVELATAAEDPAPGVFDLLAACLAGIEHGFQTSLVIWFQVQFLGLAGWGSPWETQQATGKVLGSLRALSADAASRVRLSAAQFQTAQQILDGVWLAEIGRLPRARTILTENGR